MVKVQEQGRIQYVGGWHPRLFFQAIALPVNEILQLTIPVYEVQKGAKCVCWGIVNVQWRQRNRGGAQRVQ